MRVSFGDRVVFSSCFCVLPIFFIIHGFVVNKSVLLCGFKQTKGKRHENSDSFDRTAAGIGHSVCVNHLWPVVAVGGGMKTTIELAREIAMEYSKAERFQTWTHDFMMQSLMELVAVSAVAEREACAKVCDDRAFQFFSESPFFVEMHGLAEAIRARGNT